MRIHNLYADENGESHFRDIEMEWAGERLSTKFSELYPVSSVTFRETAGDYEIGWHNAPQRQFVIVLDSGVQVTASDGEIRIIGAGEILLVEDTEGRGHCSKAVNGQVRHSIFAPLIPEE